MVGTSCPGDAVWGRSWPGGAGGGSGQGLRRRVGNPGRLRPVPAGCCQETGTHSPARPAPASSLPAPALGPGVFRILDLDSADARQIQQPGVAVPSTGGSGDHPPLQCPGMAEPAGRGAGCAQGDSPVPWEEEHSWPQLLGSRPSPGHCSSSSSVCTEDFAARFWEGMVETLLGQQEPAGAVPGEGAHPGQDESVFPTGRSLHMRPQPATELGRAPRQDRPPSRSRRESLESLGARISHLSRSHGGVAWGAPWPSPPAQPALGHRDSPRGDLLAVALPGHSWRTPGLSAGRSRAGARTGSPGSSFPRASSARTRGHPNLGMRRQEPPALWGHGGNVTFTVDGMDREGADSSRRAGTAVAAPGQWRSPVSPGLRGGLPCKGQAVPLHWSLRRSQGDTRELGAGAKPWSQGDTARAGLALLGHTWDTPHRCHTDLQRMVSLGRDREPAWSRSSWTRRKGKQQLHKKRNWSCWRGCGSCSGTAAPSCSSGCGCCTGCTGCSRGTRRRRCGSSGRPWSRIGPARASCGSISRAARGARRGRGGLGAPRPWGPPRWPRGDTAPAPAVPRERGPLRQRSAALSTSCGGSGSRSSGASGNGRGCREPWEPPDRARRTQGRSPRAPSLPLSSIPRPGQELRLGRARSPPALGAPPGSGGTQQGRGQPGEGTSPLPQPRR
ncbi:collagen alpha-2(I) chain-like isoform X10 [Prinia subflava]|uniref:collagen alpha-2(I) chain-like isoform X10 n=1 Tax=Prinia subflava TaxID=208062 RepID=UPI002FE315E4